MSREAMREMKERMDGLRAEADKIEAAMVVMAGGTPKRARKPSAAPAKQAADSTRSEAAKKMWRKRRLKAASATAVRRSAKPQGASLAAAAE